MCRLSETGLGHTLSALSRTLQQALPQQVATHAPIEQIEQQLAGLPRHEINYLQQVRVRHTKLTTIFVEMDADTYTLSPTPLPDEVEFELTTVASWDAISVDRNFIIKYQEVQPQRR